jgi:hypothetical protein
VTTAAAALAFVWLGMVLAISFVEAPLKFRAPDVTLRIGLGIGRLVFRALNAIESVLAVAVLVLVVVRPRLNRRSDAVLAGEEGSRSHAHVAYVGLECVKVVGLIVLRVLALA